MGAGITTTRLIERRFVIVCAALLGFAAPLAAADATEDLFAAIRAGSASAFETALGQGARVNGRDEFKNTPLMIAILFDRAAFISRLIEKGAGVNDAGGAGQTPLILAAQEGQVKTVRLLLERGATLRWKDGSGESAFTRAVYNNRVEVMRLLLDRGADPNERNWLGFSPVMVAAEESPDALRFLLDGGADLKKPARGGMPALMLACLRGNTQTATILLERGARVDETDAKGRTALMLAVRAPAVVRLLLRHGARATRKDHDGQTALDYARTRGVEESVRILGPSAKNGRDGSRLHGAP